MLWKRRLHAIELLDIPRCPRVVRDGATDYLHFIMRVGNAYGPIVPLLAQTLATRQAARVVDLCSGGGGPWPEMRSALAQAGAPPDLQVTLTDLFPNERAFRGISARDVRVTGDAKPANIESSEIEHAGVRTFFSAFHHFDPATARQVLRNAAASGEPIVIAEITRRSTATMAFMLLAPLLVWLTTPRLKPFSWTRLFLTYLIPAIPFVVCFDGIVSCLRTYSPDELRELFRSVDDLPYEWEVGLAKGRGPLPVTFALGLPTSRGS